MVPSHCDFLDPLELYVDEDVGFALSHPDQESGGKVFDMFSYHSTHSSSEAFFGLHDDDYEEYQIKTYMNKIVIKSSPVEHTYYADLTFWDGHDIKHHHDDVDSYTDRHRLLKSVPHPDMDGAIALQCANNNYLEWGSSFKKNRDPCTSRGICTHCKFHVEIGSLNPYYIEILDISWGEPIGPIVNEPNVLATDQQNNWSDQIITNTFSISFTDKTTDETHWSEKWGFEFKTEIATTVKIFGNGVTFTVSSTLKYDGEVGGSTTVESSTTYDKSSSYPCPGMHRCTFQLVGRQMDDAAIPFTATVRKTDGGDEKIEYIEGTWMGIKVYDTYTEYRTEELVPPADQISKM